MLNGKKCDIFISYRRTEGWELARIIYNSLKANHFNPFLDIEGIKTGDDWEQKIKHNLEEAQIFIFIVSRDTVSGDLIKKYKNAKKDDWVIKEINYAIEHKKVIIPVLAEDYNAKGVSEQLGKIFEKQGLPISFNIVDKALEDMYATIYTYLDKIEGGHEKVGRINCQPGIIKATVEKTKRCKKIIDATSILNLDQTTISKDNIIRETLYDVSTNFNELSILDVGCGNPNKIFNYFENSPKLVKYVGIENDENWIKAAQSSIPYCDRNDVDFWLMDITDEKFMERMQNKIIDQGAIQKFNIVILNEVLRYVKDPRHVIEVCKTALQPGGIIVIIEIDDGLNTVYPDKDGIIQKFYSLFDEDKEDFGNRYTGREIFTHLSNSNFSKIALRNSLLTSIDSNFYNERVNNYKKQYKILYDAFSSRLATQKYDLILNYSLNWLEKHKTKLETAFRERYVFYSTSYLVYTAVKETEDQRRVVD